MNMEYESVMGFRNTGEDTISQELTIETIVPDHCPDILEILTVAGQPNLEQCNCTEGRAEAGGTVSASVLYRPEDGGPLAHMQVTLPFQCKLERDGITSRSRLLAVPRLVRADAAIINPRKIMVRVDLLTEMALYTPYEENRGTELCSTEEDGICQRKFSCDELRMTDIISCPVRLEDPFLLKDGTERVLTVRAGTIQTEGKPVGNKLILKGNVTVFFLLQDNTGRLSICEKEYPFSQIAEVRDGMPDSFAEVSAVVRALRYDQDDTSSDTVHIDLMLELTSLIFTKVHAAYVDDAYSTVQNTDIQRNCCSICENRIRKIHTLPVRETLQTEDTIRSILETRVCLGKLNRENGDQRICFKPELHVSIFYQTDDDLVQCVSKTFSVEYEVPVKEQEQLRCSCQCSNEIYGLPVAGGIEVRFDLEFHCTCLTMAEKSIVREVTLTGPRLEDQGNAPSIILRLAHRGEDLWNVAKACGAAEQEILRANLMEDRMIEEDRMLLIPVRH